MFIIVITENRVTGVDVNPCTGTIMALKHKNTWYMFDACFPLTETNLQKCFNTSVRKQ